MKPLRDRLCTLSLPGTRPGVEGLAAKMIAARGKQRMPVRGYSLGEKPNCMADREDPFGDIPEIYSPSCGVAYTAGAFAQQHSGNSVD